MHSGNYFGRHENCVAFRNPRIDVAHHYGLLIGLQECHFGSRLDHHSAFPGAVPLDAGADPILPQIVRGLDLLVSVGALRRIFHRVV